MKTNLKYLFVASGILGSFLAFADKDLKCEIESTGELVKIYDAMGDDDKASDPTVIVLSQPAHQDGNKTIDVLRKVISSEVDKDAVYSADIDHADAAQSGKENKLFAGTRIKYIDSIEISLDKIELIRVFSDEDPLEAKLILNKTSGDVQTLSMDCNALNAIE